MYNKLIPHFEGSSEVALQHNKRYPSHLCQGLSYKEHLGQGSYNGRRDGT